MIPSLHHKTTIRHPRSDNAVYLIDYLGILVITPHPDALVDLIQPTARQPG